MDKIVVTLQDLDDIEACHSQVELFKEMFGDEVELTRTVLTEASIGCLDIGFWFMETYKNRLNVYEARNEEILVRDRKLHDELRVRKVTENMSIVDFTLAFDALIRKDKVTWANLIADMLNLP